MAKAYVVVAVEVGQDVVRGQRAARILRQNVQTIVCTSEKMEQQS